MLRKETVTPGTLELLKNLMADQNLTDFFLVGGTALSLQIGHRISIDLDLFSQNTFDENLLFAYLELNKKLRLNYLDRNTIKGQIDGVQVDLISHPYPLVEEMQVQENIRLAGLKDISAMKLNAIVGNGSRLKDFVDIAFLSSYISLEVMIDSYARKYESRNPFITLKALSYHGDINHDEPINFSTRTYSWKSIESRIGQMMKFPDKIFSAPPF